MKGFSRYMDKSFDIEFITSAVRKYSGMIIRIAYNYTRNIADSEDILQDVFVSLLSTPFIENEEHLKAWLIRITINKSKDLLKSTRKKRTIPLDEAKNYYSEKTQIVLEELAYLNIDDRTIVYLFYWEGYMAKEIGKMLKLKERAVLMRLSRARAKLKKLLEENIDG